MMTLKNQKAVFLLAFFLILFICPRFSSADFELIDAIQEFGEKRFVKPRPARLHVGPVRIHPSIRTKATWDENILLEDRDAREDVIFNIRPGAILELPINAHQIAVGYEADMEIFSKSRHAKQTDQNQNMFALIDLNFPSWYINILEDFRETSSRAGTTFTTRIPRFDQTIHPKIGVRWKRFILEGGFRHFLRDYRRDVDHARDFQLFEWTGVLFYDLFARLKALIDTSISRITYEDNHERDGVIIQTRVGIEGELIPNLIVKARVGPQFRNYDEGQKAAFNSWVASGSAEYQFRHNLLLKASAEREPIEATFGGSNYYVKHILRLGFEYEFIPKWVHFQNMKLYRNDYSERATVGTRVGYRRDRVYTYEVGMRYLASEWLEFEADYELLRRDSNFSTFDYTDHRFSLSTVARY